MFILIVGPPNPETPSLRPIQIPTEGQHDQPDDTTYASGGDTDEYCGCLDQPDLLYPSTVDQGPRPRSLEDRLLPPSPDGADESQEQRTQNPNGTNPGRRTSLVRHSDLYGRSSLTKVVNNILNYGIQNSLITSEQASEMLAEIEKARQERRIEDQEVAGVLQACFAGFPDIALGALIEMVGYLRTGAAISMANGSIGFFASWVKQEIQERIARGDLKDLRDAQLDAQNLVAILSGYSGASHSCSDSVEDGVSTPTNTQGTGELVYDPVYEFDESGNVIAYYDNYSYEDCEEVCLAQAATERVVSAAGGDARSGQASVWSAAERRIDEITEGLQARAAIHDLSYLPADNPSRDRLITQNRETAARYLGTA